MEEKIDVASDFAQFTDSSVTVDQESAPNDNSEDANAIQTEPIVLKPEEDSTEMTIKATEPLVEEVSEDVDSSLTNDSYQDSGRESNREVEYQDQPEEQVKYSDDDYTLDVLNEKYGTEYEHLDELLDDLEGGDAPEFASEQMAKLNEFITQTGRSPEDYFRTQTQNYDEMSDEKVVKEYLSLENPDLSKEEIDLFFDNTYKTNEDKYSSEESKMGNIHLKRDVSRAREELKELQDEYWSPAEQDGMTQEEAEQLEEAQVEEREEFLDAMDEELDDIDSLSFQINDKGETFDYKLTEDDKAMVGEALSNLDDFFSPYMDEQGQWDLESLALDMMAMKLQDKIVRSVANQYRSQGAEQVIREIKNPSYEPAKVSQNSQGKSIQDQIGNQIFGDSTMWD